MANTKKRKMRREPLQAPFSMEVFMDTKNDMTIREITDYIKSISEDEEFNIVVTLNVEEGDNSEEH